MFLFLKKNAGFVRVCVCMIKVVSISKVERSGGRSHVPSHGGPFFRLSSATTKLHCNEIDETVTTSGLF